MTFNVTESLLDASSALATVNWKEQVPESVRLAIKGLANYVSDNTYFDEQIQYHGITWKWTAMKCVSGIVRLTWADSIPFTADWYNILKGSYNMYLCNLGQASLAASWIILAVNSAYPAVKDLGQLVVPGLGTLTNATQIDRDHFVIGYLLDDHPNAAQEESLNGISFSGAKSFAAFQNEPSAIVEEGPFNATYGFDAVHSAGYKMTCLSSTLKPNEIVDLIKEDPNLPFRRDESGQFVCTTYIPGSDAEGAIVPTSRGAALSLPMKKKAEIAKKFNVKTASLEEVECIEQEKLYEEAMATAFGEEIKQQQEDLSTQNINDAIEPIVITRVYKNEEGSTFTSFHTSYLNGYGPPLDYLASI